MSKLDEKLLDRIKDEVALKKDKTEWSDLAYWRMCDLWPEVYRRYAEEVNHYIQDRLNLCEKSQPEWKAIVERKNEEISQLKKQLEDLTKEIVDIEQEWGNEVVELKSKLEVKEKPDFEKDWDQENANHPQGLNPYAFVYGEKIAWIKYVIPRDAAIAERDKELIEADRQLNIKKQQLAERDEKIKELENLLDDGGVLTIYEERLEKIVDDIRNASTPLHAIGVLNLEIKSANKSRYASIKASLENAWIKAERIHCGLKMKNAITNESNIVIVE